ncbi:DUF3290 domain-containing protein [Streptococcus suis]|uniref:Protein of uncharacterized function (DUF3290) n=1 Tax=Streptococcus suis TaxID=1307 RepID=A0A116NRL2_STRSU|nr:DUF3290 domain-containing protein [Streptococcus suis]MBO4126832.1 DUF3290 domain-containing protein [Streptococcus suis]NQG29149.1 DUF3290 domain-containing protein [Streptococcus suis]CYW17422.1 Protein of uncharacterised function (DUF3290) [Streptococcus suis]HEL1617752.1 DUF3290 domain-containing protein [Streptococcus suis]HEL1639355.1 DUF3290 domain-containing protein [Streptococcus suis]
MNFYDLDYIIQNQSFNLVLRSVTLIVLLVVAIATGLYYLKNRLNTRLRDISIGIVILMFIILGIQVEDYMQNNQDFTQSQVLTQFIKSVAIDNDVSEKEVYVNSTTLKDGIIVRYNGEDYTVHLNSDNNSYTLVRTHVIDHNVYINGEK